MKCAFDTIPPATRQKSNYNPNELDLVYILLDLRFCSSHRLDPPVFCIFFPSDHLKLNSFQLLFFLICIRYFRLDCEILFGLLQGFHFCDRTILKLCQQIAAVDTSRFRSRSRKEWTATSLVRRLGAQHLRKRGKSQQGKSRPTVSYFLRSSTCVMIPSYSDILLERILVGMSRLMKFSSIKFFG
jgi:hypothetical protein